MKYLCNQSLHATLISHLLCHNNNKINSSRHLGLYKKKIDGPRNETRLVPICIEQVRQQRPGRRLTTTSPATSAAGLGCAVEMPRSSPRTYRSIRALTCSTPMSALIPTSWFSNATTDGPTLITVISQNYTLHHFSGNFRL